MVPVIKPIMATVAIFAAVNQWNAFQDTLLLVTDTKLYPLQFVLYQYLNQASSLSALANTLMMTSDSKMRTLSAGLALFVGDHASLYYGAQLAGAVIAVLPLFILYIFFQKYFVKGIMIGAVKG